MTQLEKLIARVRARPPQARYRDVERPLELSGWEFRGAEGSHHVFKRAGQRPITIAVHNKLVRRAALADICDRLGLDD